MKKSEINNRVQKLIDKVYILREDLNTTDNFDWDVNNGEDVFDHLSAALMTLSSTPKLKNNKWGKK